MLSYIISDKLDLYFLRPHHIFQGVWYCFHIFLHDVKMMNIRRNVQVLAAPLSPLQLPSWCPLGAKVVPRRRPHVERKPFKSDSYRTYHLGNRRGYWTICRWFSFDVPIKMVICSSFPCNWLPDGDTHFCWNLSLLKSQLLRFSWVWEGGHQEVRHCGLPVHLLGRWAGEPVWRSSCKTTKADWIVFWIKLANYLRTNIVFQDRWLTVSIWAFFPHLNWHKMCWTLTALTIYLLQQKPPKKQTILVGQAGGFLVVSPGGPFLLEDSDQLCHQVLRRLGLWMSRAIFCHIFWVVFFNIFWLAFKWWSYTQMSKTQWYDV